MTERSVRIDVQASAPELAAYDRAVCFGLEMPLGWASSFSFMRWLSQPAIRGLVEKSCPLGTLPLQVTQSLETVGPIRADIPYRLEVKLNTVKDQVVLSYALSDPEQVVRAAGSIGFICVSEEQLGKVVP